MKFTLPWLKEHLETDAGLEAIVERLTSLGLEVDKVEPRGADLTPFTVALVTDVRRHPEAERLSLCEVDTGSERLQVVCGAPNVHTGMKGVFAPVDVTIPGTGLVLKRATIRGVESQGMLCSAAELNLGEDHSGIIELPEDAPIGVSAAEVIRVEGPVIDIELTPNRSDCFGVVGIARDLAAAGLGGRRPRNFEPVPAAFDARARVTLDFPEGQGSACPLFVAREIRGVRNGPSPAWLQERLTAIGLRPISALVDITNLVTYDLARPLHVFDADRVRGDLTLRFARDGEELEALDDRTYRLRDGMTVIADDTGPISLGGIIGGESTGVTGETTDVILEVALFDPVRTARTGRLLGIESDARTRFERGVDPELVLPATEHATRLILELCGGEAGPPVVAGRVPEPRPGFRFRINQLERLGGISLQRATIEGHLRALGFGLTPEEGGYWLTPPSWRPDVEGEADVVEELVRLHGYDRIPPVPLRRPEAVTRPILKPEQRRRGAARRALADRGLAEAVTWSFLPPEHAELFGDDGGGEFARLRNPLNAELSALRPSLLPNLLSAAAHNAARGQTEIPLFEVGPRFTGAEPGQQETVAAGVRVGPAQPRHWAEPPRPVDAIDAKGDAMAALGACGINLEALRVSTEAPPGHYHPGRSGALTLGPQTVLATFGELHPAVLRRFDLDGVPAVGFEVFLDRLPKPKARAGRARPPLEASPFPAVERDFAFLVDEAVTADALIQAVKGAEKGLIREVSLFDVYRGPGVPEGQKSLALAVRLQAADRTLTEADVEPVVRRIVAAAQKATGATLRG